MSVRDIVESTERITDYSPDGPDTRKVSGLDGYFYSARERKLDRAKKIQITPIYPPPGYITLGGALSPGKTGKGAPLRPLSFKEHGRDVPPGTKAPESAASQEASDTLIDPEDRREIEDQIAELSRKNRITLGPEQMKIKPLKKGGLFILLVNLFIIALTAGVLWLVYSIFSRQETAIIRGESNAYTSVEGQLIQQLRSESDFRLSEKERELAELQNRLSTIEHEEELLTQNFESRIRDKETEFREALLREIAAEREKLTGEGLSAERINELLGGFEKEREAYYQGEMAKFRAQIEAERKAEEENYARLRGQYQSELNTLNGERRQMQEEFRQREMELRAELQQHSGSPRAESPREVSPEGLEAVQAAQAELTRLSEQRERRRIEEERIISMFAQIRTAFQERRYEAAAEQAAALRAYLEGPGLDSFDTMQNRRRTDIFLAAFLASAARAEVNRSSSGDGQLLAQAQLISRIREAAALAESSARDGNGDRASQEYLEALSLIPDVLAAHTYLMNSTHAAAEQNHSLAGDSIRQAAAAANRGEYATALEAYHDAGVLLGLSPAESDTLVSGIDALAAAAVRDGEERALAQSLQAQNSAAEPLLARGNSELDAGQWRQALTTYSGLVSAYPLARQVTDALSGMERAFDGALRRNAALLEADAARQAAVNAESAELMRAMQEEIDRLREELESANSAPAAETGTTEAELSARNTELQREIDRLREELETEKSISAAEAGITEENRTQAGEIERLSNILRERDAELREKNAQLERISAQADRDRAPAEAYRAIINAWNLYESSPDSGMVELERFLTSEAVGNAFPGFRGRIEKLTQDAALAGHREGISNILDITETALRIRNPETRLRYFNGVQSRYAHDSATVGFVDVLRELIPEGNTESIQ